MKPKPKPIAELVARLENTTVRHIILTPVSKDARIFVKSLKEFGEIHSRLQSKKSFDLFVEDAYDLDEVYEYIKSYTE